MQGNYPTTLRSRAYTPNATCAQLQSANGLRYWYQFLKASFMFPVHFVHGKRSLRPIYSSLPRRESVALWIRCSIRSSHSNSYALVRHTPDIFHATRRTFHTLADTHLERNHESQFVLSSTVPRHFSFRARICRERGVRNVTGATRSRGQTDYNTNTAYLTMAPKLIRSGGRPSSRISFSRDSASSHCPPRPHAWMAELYDISFGCGGRRKNMDSATCPVNSNRPRRWKGDNIAQTHSANRNIQRDVFHQ